MSRQHAAGGYVAGGPSDGIPDWPFFSARFHGAPGHVAASEKLCVHNCRRHVYCIAQDIALDKGKCVADRSLPRLPTLARASLLSRSPAYPSEIQGRASAFSAAATFGI